MDFQDLAHTLGQQSKKAKELALKPVHLVASPVVQLHEKVKKTVFGPDLSIFVTVLHQQQVALLEKKYLAFLKSLGTVLKKEHLSTKKSTALLNACMQTRKVAAQQPILDDHIEKLIEMLGELTYSCKQGIATKREENGSRTVDKRLMYTSEEYHLVSEQLHLLSAKIKSRGKGLENDMYPLLLEDIPSVASLEEQMQVSKTQLPLLQKELQKTYRTTVDHLVEGKRMMKQFAQKKHEFDLLHTKDNSLFASEKTKAKNIRIQLEKELNALVTTTFAPRQKKMKTLLQTIYTQRASIEKKDHQASQARQKFFKTRQKRSKKISRNAEIQQQNEPKEVKKIMTHIQSTAQGTKHLLHALKASTTDKQIDGLIQQYHQVENMGGKQRTAIATAYRKTGMYTQLPLAAQQLLIDYREHYLIDHISLLRDTILAQRMYKRLLQKQLRLLKEINSSFQESSSVTALGSIKAALKGIQKDMQTVAAAHDKELAASKENLATAKSELRDTITRRRLAAWKRHWYQEFTAAHLAESHADQLQSLIQLKETGNSIIKQKEKEISQAYHLKQTMLHDHQQTLIMTKKKTLKKKIALLDQEVTSLETLLHTLHELIDHLKLQKEETVQLVKKYRAYAAHTHKQLLIQKKYIIGISEKLKNSPLQQWIDCTSIKK